MRVRRLTAKQVSEWTGTPVRTLYAWAKEPGHPFPKPVNISSGRKGLRWNENEIEKFLTGRDRARAEEMAATNSALRLARAG